MSTQLAPQSESEPEQPLLAGLHVPTSQISPATHACRQSPQCPTSAEMFVHTPLHETAPGAQLHWPPTHDEPGPHACPHAPQFAALDVTSVHTPLHGACPF